MEKTIFDLVNDKFFYVFGQTNYKRINYILLQKLYTRMNLDEQVLSKSEIVDYLMNYVENLIIDTDKTNKEFCLDRVNDFISFGWLIEDTDGFEKTYQLDENGIKLLQAMKELTNNENKQYEYTGYVFDIYNSLTNFDKSHSVDIVESVYRNSVELNDNLRGLNVNIKKYLSNLLRNNNSTPKDILQVLLYDYQDKVILKAFKNLREKDNPHKYKIEILSKINSLLEYSLDIMVRDYIDKKCDSKNTVENRKAGREFFVSKLQHVHSFFTNIEDTLSKLEKQNTKYVGAAQARINFLLNENKDLEGLLIKSLKELNEVDDDFFDQEILPIYSGLNIDDKSLYVKPEYKEKTIGEIDEIDTNTNFDLEAYQDILFKDNEFSVSNINKFIINAIGNNEQIHLKDIRINDSNDVIKFFLVLIYRTNRNIDYKVIKTNQTFIADGWLLDDYIIERRKK